MEIGRPIICAAAKISPWDAACSFSDRPDLQYSATDIFRQSGWGLSLHNFQLRSGRSRRNTSTPTERCRPAPKYACATSFTSDPSGRRMTLTNFVTKFSMFPPCPPDAIRLGGNIYRWVCPTSEYRRARSRPATRACFAKNAKAELARPLQHPSAPPTTNPGRAPPSRSTHGGSPHRPLHRR